MKTIGILGAGQLAQLLSHSAYQLGLRTLSFASNADEPAARTGAIFIGDLNNIDDCRRFAQQCDVITLENENINADIITVLQQYCPCYPGTDAITIAQDRWLEKSLFQALGIATASFADISSLEDLHQALQHIGTPCILKTRRFGYDGKGQFRLQNHDQAEEAWQAIGAVPAILEGFVDFSAEVSCLAARSISGDTVVYPLITNCHHEGILRESWLPSAFSALQNDAATLTTKILHELNYVGLLAVELFVTNNGLIANEIAPRVHNSGHLTIEACATSQFENHIRAICDLPLGTTDINGNTCMLNIIGKHPTITPTDGVHYYDYGKAARPGRKLGHITVHGKTDIGAMVERLR